VKLYQYISLVAAKLVGRRHNRDVDPPGLKELKNAFVSKSDSAITARPDFNPITEDILAVSSIVDFGTADDDDYLNSAAGMYGTDDLIWLTKMAPVTWDGTASSMASSAYQIATASITSGSTTLTATDSEWITNAWPGCLVEIDDPGTLKYYVVGSVNSDTEIELTEEFAEATKSGVNCNIYKVHQPAHADYKLNIQPYTSGIIYSCPTITMPVNARGICGPFYASVVETSTDQVWVDVLDDDVVVDDIAESPHTAKIATDGTNWMAITHVDGDDQISISSDPTDDWEVVSGPSDFDIYGQIMAYGSRFYIAGRCRSPANRPGYAYTDDLGTSWEVKPNADSAAADAATGIATNGSRIVISMGAGTASNEFAYYTDNNGTDWVACTFGIDPALPGIGAKNAYYLNSYFVLPGVAYGAVTAVMYSSAGAEFTYSFSPPSYSLSGSCAYSSSGDFFVFPSGSSYRMHIVDDITDVDNYSTRLVNRSVTSNLVYDGEKFFYGSGLHSIFSTTDFITSTLEHTSAWDDSIYQWGAFSRVTNQCVMLGVLEDTGSGTDHAFQTAVSGQNQTTTSWHAAEFTPLSDIYRSLTHSVLDGYVMLLGTREYQSTNNTWEYYPRRIRWSTPLTYNDFSSSGSGTADLNGSGAILDSRTVNGRIITFESSAIGSIAPRGYATDPWEYDVIKSNIRAVSNPVVVDDMCYFIDDTGLLRATNGISVESPPFSFDLSEYDDFNADKPVWLTYAPELESLCIYNPSDDNQHIYFVETEAGTVTRSKAPELDLGGAADEGPKSVVCVENSSDRRMMVSYNPDGSGNGDSSILLVSELSTGDTITGVDEWTAIAADDTYHNVDVQTGQIFIAPEGGKTGIKHLIVNTYTDGTSTATNPILVVQCKSLEDDDWHDNGDNSGTTTISTTGITGADVVWSTYIGAGNDAATAYTTPCLAQQARVYFYAGAVYTEKTAGTDYTVTAAKQITFTTPPPSGTLIYTYWENEPSVRVEVGDMFQSTEGYHRLTSIERFDDGRLDHYLSAGSDATATHHPGTPFPVGEGQIKIGLSKLVEGVQLRFLIFHRADGDATVTKITGVSVGHIPAGEKIVEP